jgi:hypothetical protein
MGENTTSSVCVVQLVRAEPVLPGFASEDFELEHAVPATPTNDRTMVFPSSLASRVVKLVILALAFW